MRRVKARGVRNGHAGCYTVRRPVVRVAPSHTEPFMPRRTPASPYLIGCLAAILLGCIVRAWHVLPADFPLNDGGLFYQMTEELQREHYRLPSYTAYNAMHIPFAYPPLGFYAAGLLSDATSMRLIDTFRWLPLLATCGTLVAFALLAREMLASRVAIVAGMTAFALFPRSFGWLVMGGGLTRALGVLFTILALHQAYRLFTTRNLRYALSAGLFSGLTPLSHLGTAPFLAVSLVLFFVAFGRHRQGVIGLGVVGAVAIVVTAPWWVTVVTRHGFDPFLAARQTGGSVFTPGLVRRNVIGRLARLGAMATGEPLFPVLAVLALFGAIAAVSVRALAIPAWWIAALTLDARAGATYATIPMSLLAGIGFADVLLPLVLRLAPVRGVSGAQASRDISPPNDTAGDRMLGVFRRYGLAAAITAFLVLYSTLGALTRDADLGAENAFLRSLTRDQRGAMAWAASNTPPSSRFFVVPQDGWAADRVAEWFPALAQRTSVATVQGREWLPERQFERFERLYRNARDCAARDVACVEGWARTARVGFTHLFVPKTADGPCCRELSRSLRSDARYQLVFDGPGAEVFARIGDENVAVPRPAGPSSTGEPPNAAATLRAVGATPR